MNNNPTANHFSSLESNYYDIILVGHGVAGSILSRTLSEKFNILVLESGGNTFSSEIQELNEYEITGRALRPGHINRVRQLGGGTNIWPGRCMMLERIDFTERPWISDISWPFSYGELYKEYKELPLMFGFPDPNIQLPESIVTEFSLQKDSIFKKVFARWAKRVPRYDYKSEIFKEIKRKRNVTILCHATVKRLQVFEGVATGCIFVGMDAIEYKVKGKIIILATGGIENARILLSTKKIYGIDLDPSDNIGKYYMDHPTIVSPAIVLKKRIQSSPYLMDYNKNGRYKFGISYSNIQQVERGSNNSYIEVSPEYPAAYNDAFSRFLNAYKSIKGKRAVNGLIDLIFTNPVSMLDTVYLLAPSELLPHSISHAYHRFRKALSIANPAKKIVLSHHLEQRPIRQSFVSLTGKTNKFGIDQIALNWQIDVNDIEDALRLERDFLNYLSANNVVDLSGYKHNVEIVNDASHHIGTTRMSTSEINGVVDHNCRMHTLKNVYVAGSSVFPTSGSANPTWTIAALAHRLSKYINNEYYEK